ncbi:MAG: hypothetical protein ACM3NV_09880, partial [Syntrophothermus sp.]
GAAPVTLTGIVRIRPGGSEPSGLEQVVLQIDRHVSIERRGVPVCSPARLIEATLAQARSRCRGALVGTGFGRAEVSLPGQPTVPVSSRLSLFNGPLVEGNPSLIAHAYETLPKPQALVVPIEIRRVHHGRYGSRVQLELPPIADGYGVATFAEATIGRSFVRRGRRVGYFDASCEGGRLQVHGTLSFTNGDLAPATFVTPCRSPG